MASETNGAQDDCISPVSGRLLYSSKLTIDPIMKYHAESTKFHAKINEKPGLPALIYAVVFIFQLVQLIGPSFMLDSDKIWVKTETFPQFLQYCSVIWHGYPSKDLNPRIIEGLVIAILTIIYSLAVFIITISFKSLHTISHRMAQANLFLGKYFFPLLMPVLVSGLITSIYDLTSHVEFIPILTLVLGFIGCFCEFYFINMLCSRLLIENNIAHEWNSSFKVVFTFVITLEASFGIIGDLIGGIGNVVFMIIMFLIYIAFGIFVLYTQPTMKHRASDMISACCFTGAVNCAVNIIIFFTNPLNGAVSIIVFVLALIVSLIGCSMYTRHRIRLLTNFFNQCEELKSDCQDLLESRWKHPFKFIVEMRLGLQTFHPFYLTWKPFNYANQIFPFNHSILLMWARSVALFPTEKELFRWIMVQYSQLKNNFTKSAYLNQMIDLSAARITVTVPSVRKQLDNVQEKFEYAKALQKRFWENILQKSIESFWDDTINITKSIKVLSEKLHELLDSYPNNYDIVDAYCKFCLEIKIDLLEFQKWKSNRSLLKSGKLLKLDFAIAASQDFFPEVARICGNIKIDSNNKDEINDESNTKLSDSSEEIQTIQVKSSMQDMINHSPIGSSKLGSFFVGISMIVTIVLYSLFINYFKTNIVNDIENKCLFIESIQKSLYDISYLAIFMSTYPLIYDNKIVYDEAKMQMISPTLYPAKLIKKMSFSKMYVQMSATNCIAQLDEINNIFAKLDTNQPYVRAIYEAIFAQTATSQSMTALMMKTLLDMTSIIKEYDNPKDYLKDPRYLTFDGSLDSLTSIYEPVIQNFSDEVVSTKSDLLKELNNWLVVTMTVCLCLVTIPTILLVFHSEKNMNRIRNIFVTIQSKSVRTILEDVLSNKSKSLDDGAPSILLSSNSDTHGQGWIITIQFLLTFFFFLFACMVIYFEAFVFLDDTSNSVRGATNLHPPIFFTLFAMNRVIRSLHYEVYTTADLTTTFPRSYHMIAGKLDAKQARSYYEYGYWGNVSLLNLYFKSGQPVNRFSDVLPFYNPDRMPERTVSLLEELIASDYADAGEYSLNFIEQYLVSDTIHTQPNFYDLLYYIAYFSPTSRDVQFIDAIDSEIKKVFDGATLIANTLLVIVIIIQVFSIFELFAYFAHKYQLLHSSLQFFMFFDPQTIMQNPSIVNLLAGRAETDMINQDYRIEFSNSEEIVSKLNQAVVLVDPSIKVLDTNHAFNDLVDLKKTDIIGKLLSDIIRGHESVTNSIVNLVFRIQDALSGKGTITFVETMIFDTVSSKVRSVEIQAVCLTENGAATENDIKNISAVLLIMEDLTEYYELEHKILDQQQRTTEMLNKVVPSVLVSQLQSGTDSISFSVQSVSVVSISVDIGNPKVDDKLDTPFILYGQLFNIFDEISNDYPLISKVRTFANKYTYVSGLFTEINKPDKHAEEATRMAVRLLTMIPEFESKLGRKITLTIGMSSGGPIVAGIVSLMKPTFQLIGPPVELSLQMMKYGKVNQIHVTRSVYEFIYAYNFNVTDNGDVQISGGRYLRTYVIVP